MIKNELSTSRISKVIVSCIAYIHTYTTENILPSRFAGGNINRYHRRSHGGNLQGKFASAPPAHQVHPQAKQESIFRTFLLCGEDLELQLVVLDRLLKVTTKEKVVNFFRKRLHRRQNPGYAYDRYCELRHLIKFTTTRLTYGSNDGR